MERFTPTGCVYCGQTYYGDECRRCAGMPGWIVIGVRSDGLQPFEVHRRQGESDVDLVNKTGEIADARPDIVYTVVREREYRNGILEGIRWLGDRNYKAVNARVYRGPGRY